MPKSTKCLYVKLKVLLFVAESLIILLSVSFSFAQNHRDYIRKSITSWGSCRNVAITDTGGDVALNYTNQYSYSGIPTGLANAIKELHDASELIDDIEITESGSWLLLYGNNGFRWNNIPYGLEAAIREFNSNNEVVTSATFNDAGDWIVISTKNIKSSSDNIYDWIRDGMNSYGTLWAAHLTNDGLVLCFQHGFKFLGNVPEKLKTALKTVKFDVYRIKFTSGGSYFYADKDGHYNYWM